MHLCLGGLMTIRQLQSCEVDFKFNPKVRLFKWLNFVEISRYCHYYYYRHYYRHYHEYCYHYRVCLLL